MTYQFLPDFQINPETATALHQLLDTCFPGFFDQSPRDYFKQLPHFRLLAYDENKTLVGQVGIDYRVMNLNGKPVRTFGIVDLCVSPTAQGKGIGKQLLNRVEQLAKQHTNRIDVIFLVTETPNYYERLGYQVTKIETTWLKIDAHQSLGIGKELIDDALFMVKAVGEKEWEDGKLDMLGYMF